MTGNQTSQLVKNPHTKKAIEVLGRFVKMEAEYKAMEKESKAATELIKEAMIASGVDRLEVDIPGYTGYITLAERTNYRTEDISKVPEKFTKAALDTDKIKATQTLTGLLPVGVSESKTQYITKKFKVVE